MLKFEYIDKNKDKKLSHEEVLNVFKMVKPNAYFQDSKVKGTRMYGQTILLFVV